MYVGHFESKFSYSDTSTKMKGILRNFEKHFSWIIAQPVTISRYVVK